MAQPDEAPTAFLMERCEALSATMLEKFQVRTPASEILAMAVNEELPMPAPRLLTMLKALFENGVAVKDPQLGLVSLYVHHSDGWHTIYIRPDNGPTFGFRSPMESPDA